jgi:hypothetical protein
MHLELMPGSPRTANNYVPRQQVSDILGERGAMSRVEQLEQQIASLDQDELRVLREWFARFDADDWDRQIASDAKNGKLARLAERALKDHKAGRSTDL